MPNNTTLSKNKCSPKNKSKITDTIKIDMRDILSHGFDCGMAMDGTLFFHGEDKAICILNNKSMSLMYRAKIRGLWRYVKQTISLDWLSPDDENRDAYFICPECGKRTLVLHQQEASLACRKCSQLTYDSICSQYKFVPYATSVSI